MRCHQYVHVLICVYMCPLLQKLNALQEEWLKLEEDKKVEVVKVPRGTGKFILEVLFATKKKKKRSRPQKPVGVAKESLIEKQQCQVETVVCQTKDVFIPLDAFQAHKYDISKPVVADLVEVVTLPSAYEGISPPTSARSVTLNASYHLPGHHKKKHHHKKKEKGKREVEEELKQLRVVNEEYMNKRRIGREKLMLDFSLLNDTNTGPPAIK